MNDYENAIFVSYAWSGESERTVDELERAFAAHGIKIIRDKKELDYKGSIEAFEQRIGQGQCVILVISDKYLRSEHCMYELVEVAENRNLRQRVFPVVLADAHIFKAVERLEYIQYWEAKIEELNQAIKNIKVMTNLAGFSADLDKYSRIRAEFDGLTDLLSDMNTLTPEIHAASGYATLIEAVEQALTQENDLSANTTGKPIPQERKTNVSGDKISQKAGKGSTQIGKAHDVKIDSGPTFNIEGGIHAKRDVIMRDQINYNNQSQTANIQTPPEFVAELTKLQTQIAALVQQSDLTNAQRRNLQAAQEQVTQAATEAQKPQPDASQVQETLSDAKETMDMLSGSVTSAVGLGTALAGLIQVTLKLFGG